MTFRGAKRPIRLDNRRIGAVKLNQREKKGG